MRYLLLVLFGGFMVAPANAQVPPDLPAANRVTDPARPDFGYMQPWAGSELTVAIAFGAGCKPCEESLPFYKRLATAPEMDRTTRRLIILTEGGVWPVINAIEKHPEGFKTIGAVSYPQDDRFKLKTLPAIFIFDGKWTRRGEWQGRLTPNQEAEVLALIETITAEARKKGDR
jgi:hypothetical protein